MMCAWLFFARLGIFIAGQYKTVWPEGMEWCGQKRWFIVSVLRMFYHFFSE